MNQKELKKVIKHLVKECLFEVLAESVVDNRIRQVVAESVQLPSRSPQGLSDEFSEAINNATSVLSETRSKPVSTPSREDLVRKILGDDMPAGYEDLMLDTVRSDNPILREGGHDETRQELVSEGQLRSTGLYKDYSRFV